MELLVNDEGGMWLAISIAIACHRGVACVELVSAVTSVIWVGVVVWSIEAVQWPGWHCNNTCIH